MQTDAKKGLKSFIQWFIKNFKNKPEYIPINFNFFYYGI